LPHVDGDVPSCRSRYSADATVAKCRRDCVLSRRDASLLTEALPTTTWVVCSTTSTIDLSLSAGIAACQCDPINGYGHDQSQPMCLWLTASYAYHTNMRRVATTEAMTPTFGAHKTDLYIWTTVTIHVISKLMAIFTARSVAERGIAKASCLSVCPSVRL